MSIRVKLLVQPYEERLCILASKNSTISDLKLKVFHAIQFYSIYKDFLDLCTIHLELNIDNELYFIPEHYTLSECYKSKDVFTVTFIENRQYQNRQSIHMKYQAKLDIQNLKNNNLQANVNPNMNVNNMNNINPNSMSQFKRPNQINKNDANEFKFDDGNYNINDIKEWMVTYLHSQGSLHAVYRTEYKSFISKLQERFPKSIQNIFNVNFNDFQTFLMQHCGIHMLQTQHGWEIQSESLKNKSSNVVSNNNKKSNKNKNKNNNNNKIEKTLHPILQNINLNANANANNKPKQPIKPPMKSTSNRQRQLQNKMSAINNQNELNQKLREIASHNQNINAMNNINNKTKEELPTTPDSPTDDEQDNDDNDNKNDNTIVNQNEQKIDNETYKMNGARIDREEINEYDESVDMMADMSVKILELFDDILLKCYKSVNNKYVLLSELERLIKNEYRDKTPYELDVIELDYVCFKQFLTSYNNTNNKINISIVNIKKQLIDNSNDIKEDNNNKCPEIETYVSITDANDEQKTEERTEILENIKYLSACNIVTKMKPNDLYNHIKLIHSQCLIENIYDNNAHNVTYSDNINQNSFDEIAEQLRSNQISGKRILEMRWSDWEMLAELSRYDRDHQDFIEDIIMDFFYPFITGQELSNIMATYKTQQTQEQMSIFNDENIRSKFTLCIDYGLFYNNNINISPIFHYFVKRCELYDCDKLLRLNRNISVDIVMGEYSAMHIVAWRGKFKLLAYLTHYGGNPMIKNKKGETAFQAGRKYKQKLKWYYAQFPQFRPQTQIN